MGTARKTLRSFYQYSSKILPSVKDICEHFQNFAKKSPTVGELLYALCSLAGERCIEEGLDGISNKSD